MPWTDVCWTVGSCAFRWPAMDGPLRPHVVEAAVAEDAMAEVANVAVPVTAIAVVPARQNVPVADFAGLIPGLGLAPGTVPAREANRPAARSPDPAAHWTGERTTKSI